MHANDSIGFKLYRLFDPTTAPKHFHQRLAWEKLLSHFDNESRCYVPTLDVHQALVTLGAFVAVAGDIGR